MVPCYVKLCCCFVYEISVFVVSVSSCGVTNLDFCGKLLRIEHYKLSKIRGNKLVLNHLMDFRLKCYFIAWKQTTLKVHNEKREKRICLRRYRARMWTFMSTVHLSFSVLFKCNRTRTPRASWCYSWHSWTGPGSYVKR